MIKLALRPGYFVSQCGSRIADHNLGLLTGFLQSCVALRQGCVPVLFALAVNSLARCLEGLFILSRFGFHRRRLLARPRQRPPRGLLSLLQDGHHWTEEDALQNNKKQEHQDDRGDGLKEEVLELIKNITHLVWLDLNGMH